MGIIVRILLAFCVMSPAAWTGTSLAAEAVPAPAATPANPSSGASAVPAPSPVQGACPYQVAGAPLPGGMIQIVPGPDYASPWWKWWACARCRLPHLTYPPPVPGTYYFRPYSVIGLRDNQADVLLWGGDPRDPYANDVFDRVYTEVGSGPARPKE